MKHTCINDIYIQYAKTNNETDIWFFHGFGENGDSFNNCFQSALQYNFSLYVPDFPGASKRSKWKDKFNNNIDQMTADFFQLIKKVSLENDVIIVAHSMGSILATKVADALGDQVISMISIEGFLIPDDIRFSSKSKKYDKPDEFHNVILDEVKKHYNDNEIMKNYYSRLKQWSPFALFTFSRYAYDKTRAQEMSRDFLKLACQKVYIYGEKSLKNTEKKFLENNQEITVFSYDCQHWVMNEKPEVYDDIASYIDTLHNHQCKI
jgi:pimeloyl-ACP methyl ester carboxylesterase